VVGGDSDVTYKRDLVDELPLKCDLTLTCANCGRLYLVDESGGRSTRAINVAVLTEA
jgi:hypothetical protein